VVNVLCWGGKSILMLEFSWRQNSLNEVISDLTEMQVLGGYKFVQKNSLHGKVWAKFILEQAMKAQRGSSGIALIFL